jgi:hypothetical protein
MSGLHGSSKRACLFTTAFTVCSTVFATLWLSLNQPASNYDLISPMSIESQHTAFPFSRDRFEYKTEESSPYDTDHVFGAEILSHQFINTMKNLEQGMLSVKRELHNLFNLIERGYVRKSQNSAKMTKQNRKNTSREPLKEQNPLPASQEHEADILSTRDTVTKISAALTQVRAWEKSLEERKGDEDLLPPNRLDCFDVTRCVLIRHRAYGRSGNRLTQLRRVASMLSVCSGAAISPKNVTDDVVHFPSMQVFGKSSCFPAWDRLDDMEHIFGQLQTKCQIFDFSWDGHYEGMRCSLTAPPSFQRVHLDSRFPSWLEVSMEAWAVPLPSTTAVMHFRGGDIFSARPHYMYTQPVCDHYIQSFRHSGAACAVLVAEDDSNPCVAAVVAGLNCTHRPAKCGPACAFTLLARARLVIASASSFLSTALETFRAAERRVYFSYCAACPVPVRAWDSARYCTETDRSELFPWNASARQLELLRTRPASVNVC